MKEIYRSKLYLFVHHNVKNILNDTEHAPFIYVCKAFVYLYVYDSRERADALLNGLDAGATSHTLHSKGDCTQIDFLCHDCFV